jgi:hypothetical protein
LREAGGDRNPFSAPVIASLQKEIEVPEAPGGRSDEPMDLGTIELEARNPGIQGGTRPGGRVRTADAKVVAP